LILEEQISNKQIMDNLRHCPSFDRCNKNICPLDLEMELRHGGGICKWMREAEERFAFNTMITFGGKTMPDELLIYVPKENIKYLNSPSKNRANELLNEDVYLPKIAPDKCKSGVG
jgi:hypothetical protein